MALPFEELEAITNDYFMADGGKAIDIYFYSSFLLTLLLKDKGGIWERPDGGERIRIPLEYDGQESGFYGRGDTLSSDDREALNAAFFLWKHAYSNATLYRIDELKNSGAYAEVQLVVQRVAGAQKSITKTLAGSIYDLPGGDSKRLTGLLACCNANTALAYGSIAEDDLQAVDGTKPWKGRIDTTTEAMALSVLQDMRSTAKVRDGKGGKPDLIVTTETLYNIIASRLQLQQRFTKGEMTAKAGFTGLEHEGCEIFPDDFCPSGYAFALNKQHLGFAVHQNGLYMRSKWAKIPDSPEDRTMKIYWDGNLVVNNRKAHIAHSNLS